MNGKVLDMGIEKKIISYKASKTSEYIEFKDYRAQLADK